MYMLLNIEDGYLKLNNFLQSVCVKCQVKCRTLVFASSIHQCHLFPRHTLSFYPRILTTHNTACPKTTINNVHFSERHLVQLRFQRPLNEPFDLPGHPLRPHLVHAVHEPLDDGVEGPEPGEAEPEPVQPRDEGAGHVQRDGLVEVGGDLEVELDVVGSGPDGPLERDQVLPAPLVVDHGVGQTCWGDLEV